ncbi:MAG: class A beta-lactamase-related serine hydrolase [Flavobacterium sp.]|uniref:serine hydrolase domain-containing protein n=1 Tax=Flavobacterium sp. TaxID=239 RepID=UPI00120906A9|nr:serine hydrolase domain-containing protein [Flavobacterium sp.]RZJ63357.1 MAG: class A beta-lactamase-related serine hydrolase [Flavobacterium sp.]
MKRFFIFLLLLVEFGLHAQSDAKFKKIDSLLTYLTANHKFMGSVALRENDKVVFAKAYGFLDSATRKKADDNTKYKIGSITKTFTAVMIIQLVEENKLKFEDKLSKFFPKIPNSDKITIEMLLRHRTGIHEFLADSVITANITRKHTRKEIVNRIAGYTPDFEPDSKFEYSNSNYSLLGYIIEDVTKKPYAQNLEARITKKLKLSNTYLPDHIDVSKNEAFSFTFAGSDWKQMDEWTNTLAFSAGALASTPTDVTAFMKALLDGKLISAASLEKMKTIKEGYGMGLITLPFGEKRLYGHTGGIENFRSAVGYNPEEKLGVALFVNGDNYSRNDIMVGILTLYYELPYTFPTLKAIVVSPEKLQSYAGTYASAGFPLKIVITTNDGQLIAQATGQSSFPLEAISESDFEFKAAGVNLHFTSGKMTLKQSGMNIEFNKE